MTLQNPDLQLKDVGSVHELNMAIKERVEAGQIVVYCGPIGWVYDHDQPGVAAAIETFMKVGGLACAAFFDTDPNEVAVAVVAVDSQLFPMKAIGIESEDDEDHRIFAVLAGVSWDEFVVNCPIPDAGKRIH